MHTKHIRTICKQTENSLQGIKKSPFGNLKQEGLISMNHVFQISVLPFHKIHNLSTHHHLNGKSHRTFPPHKQNYMDKINYQAQGANNIELELHVQ